MPKLRESSREVKIDPLLEGEGVSEFAGRIQGLVSCRARVEFRLIKLPGRSIGTIERGVGAGVDLTGQVFLGENRRKGSGVVFGQAASHVVDRCPKTTPDPVDLVEIENDEGCAESGCIGTSLLTNRTRVIHRYTARVQGMVLRQVHGCDAAAEIIKPVVESLMAEALP